MLFKILVILHTLGATVWTGGHSSLLGLLFAVAAIAASKKANENKSRKML